MIKGPLFATCQWKLFDTSAVQYQHKKPKCKCPFIQTHPYPFIGFPRPTPKSPAHPPNAMQCNGHARTTIKGGKVIELYKYPKLGH